jgi:hypothetical protein
LSGKTVLSRVCAVAGVFIGVAVMAAAPAFAHAQEDAGPYHMEVGWGTEPAYAGFQNSVQVLITNSADSSPVTDVTDTLQVEVSTGDAKQTFPIVPDFEVGGDGTPGDYRAWLIPTRPGTYTFHITGTIDGQATDVSVTSGDTTFDDVQDPSSVQFPVKDPTVGDISQKVDAVSGRVDNATAAAQNAASQASKAKDDASSTKTIAIIALVIGVIGVVLGGVSLARKRQ